MSRKSQYQIVHVDAFDWLARRRARSIQAVVTDPPYGVVEYLPEQLKKKRNGNGGVWRLPQAFDGRKRRPAPRFTDLSRADHRRIACFYGNLAPLLYEVLVPGGHVVLASNTILSHLIIPAFVSCGFEARGQIARVVKTLRGGDRPKGAHEEYAEISVIPRSCWEPRVIFRRPCEGRVRDNLAKWATGGFRRPQRDRPFSDLIECGPARGVERAISGHPSLKPQAFMRQIVRAVLPLGKGIVLDPFMGSGSTIAAAEGLGFRSIGLEIDEQYFQAAIDTIPKLAHLSADASGTVR